MPKKYDPNALTKYSSPAILEQRYLDGAAGLKSYLIWLFWDTSSEFMANHGLPTDADVKEWIKVLESRKDAKSAGIQDCISECINYITPFDQLPSQVAKATKPLKVKKGTVKVKKKDK